MKVFVDTNVLLDYLLERKDFVEEAKKIAKFQKEEGIVSAIKAELKGIAPSMSDEKLKIIPFNSLTFYIYKLKFAYNY